MGLNRDLPNMGNIWQSLVDAIEVYFIRQFWRYSWIDMHGYAWLFIDTHGYSWISMLISMDMWISTVSTDIHKNHGYPWSISIWMWICLFQILWISISMDNIRWHPYPRVSPVLFLSPTVEFVASVHHENNERESRHVYQHNHGI